MEETRYARLLKLLRARFPAATIELFDDSAAHAGHVHGGMRADAATEGIQAAAHVHGGTRAGIAKDGIEVPAHGHGFSGETHYRLRIVDAEFHSLTLIQRHRAILAAVKPETDAGMHSFVIESAAAPDAH